MPTMVLSFGHVESWAFQSLLGDSPHAGKKGRLYEETERGSHATWKELTKREDREQERTAAPTCIYIRIYVYLYIHTYYVIFCFRVFCNQYFKIQTKKCVMTQLERDIYYIISSICFVSCFGPPFTGGVKIWWGDACSNRVCIHIFFNHETLPTRLYFVFFKISATFAFQVKCIAIIKRLSASSEMHSIWYQKQTRCPLGNTKS